MKDVLTYKDYVGSVHFSPEDKVFFGKIEGIDDLVNFEADNVSDLIQEFRAAVNDYLKHCQEQKFSPRKSTKSSFNVRVSPEIHVMPPKKQPQRKGEMG